MREIYFWWDNKKQISKKEIETMKNNMKKVPIIQKKSDEYHLKQEIEAEEFIKKNISNKEKIVVKITKTNEINNKNHNIFKRMIKIIKNLLKNIS